MFLCSLTDWFSSQILRFPETSVKTVNIVTGCRRRSKYILTSLAGAKAENFPPEFKGIYSPGGLGVFCMISASQPPRTFLMWSQRNARNFPRQFRNWTFPTLWPLC